jgi:hypothetical protein
VRAGAGADRTPAIDGTAGAGTVADPDRAAGANGAVASGVPGPTGLSGRTGCAVCRSARGGPGPLVTAAVEALEGPVLRLQERAGAVGFARRYGSPRHAGLVLLGGPPCAG